LEMPPLCEIILQMKRRADTPFQWFMKSEDCTFAVSL
jgi:hypothetical protein